MATSVARGYSTSTLIKFSVGIVVAIFLAIAAIGSGASVDAGHVAVVTQFGAVTGTEFPPGFHMKWPFVQSTADFNTQIQLDRSDPLETSSNDLQNVTTQVSINYHPDPAHITTIYQNIGTDYAAKVLSPAILESVKAVTARHTASELVQQRDRVKQELQDLLSAKVQKYHIIIDTVSITNFHFSDAFNQAIEAKQVAQQHVLTAQQSLDQAKIDAQQQVVTAQAAAQAQVATANGNATSALINAKAAAQAQTLQARTLTPSYLQFAWITHWDGRLPQYSTGSAPLLTLPIVK